MSNVQVINTPSLNLVNAALDQRPKSLLTLMEELSQVMNLFEEVIAQFDTKEQEYHADAANISAQVSQKMADKARANQKNCCRKGKSGAPLSLGENCKRCRPCFRDYRRTCSLFRFRTRSGYPHHPSFLSSCF